MMTHELEPIKQIVDIASVGATLAALMTWLPPIAAVLSVVWGILRIYESYLSIQVKRKELKE